MVPGYHGRRRIVRHISGPGTGLIGDRYVDERGDVWEVVERCSCDGTATVGARCARIEDGHIVEG